MFQEANLRISRAKANLPSGATNLLAMSVGAGSLFSDPRKTSEPHWVEFTLQKSRW